MKRLRVTYDVDSYQVVLAITIILVHVFAPADAAASLHSLPEDHACLDLFPGDHFSALHLIQREAYYYTPQVVLPVGVAPQELLMGSQNFLQLAEVAGRFAASSASQQSQSQSQAPIRFQSALQLRPANNAANEYDRQFSALLLQQENSIEHRISVPSLNQFPVPMSIDSERKSVAMMLQTHKHAAAVREPVFTYQTHFPVIEFTRRLHNSTYSGEEGQSDITSWTLWFLASIVFVALLLQCYLYKMQVDIPVPNEQPAFVTAAKGRPCWNYCCIILSVAFCWSVFYFTLLSVASVNEDVEKHPQKDVQYEGKNVTGLRYPIESPGLRAYEAGGGVVLTIAIAAITIVNWRYFGQVKITTSLLIQVMLRGATLSLLIALALEGLGQSLLGATGIASTGIATVGTFLMMVIVGFSEELAKLIVVCCCTSLTVAALQQANPGRNCLTSCWCFRRLIETPRALALAGLAAGFGFMTVENAGYIMSAASQPPTAYLDDDSTKDDPDKLSGYAISIITAFTIAVRVLLNIHPWLAGVSAIYAAQLAFAEGAGSASLSLLQFFSCSWQSALIHAAFDFGLTVVPGIVGIFWPPVFWFFSRRLFYHVWLEAVEVPAAAPPARAERQLLDHPLEPTAAPARAEGQALEDPLEPAKAG